VAKETCVGPGEGRKRKQGVFLVLLLGPSKKIVNGWPGGDKSFWNTRLKERRV